MKEDEEHLLRILVQILTKIQEGGATMSDLFGWLCEEVSSLDEEEDHSQLPSFCLFVVLKRPVPLAGEQ